MTSLETKNPTRLIVLSVALALLPNVARAATPGIINYQGRIQVGGSDFTGTGLFKFALVNAAGNVSYWSNDGSSATGNEPSKAVSIPVAKGLYSVLLGDVTLTNMTTIPVSAFAKGDTKLRIWFDDGGGVNKSQLLAPDQVIAAAGYAMAAAAVDDGSVTTAKLAAGVIPTALPPSGAAGGDLAGTYPNPSVTLTSANTANTIVKRDANGNFSAGSISATTTSLGNTSAGTFTVNNVNAAGYALNASTNANAGAALTVLSTGQGSNAAQFQISNLNSGAPAVNVLSNSTYGIYCDVSAGKGEAGVFLSGSDVALYCDSGGAPFIAKFAHGSNGLKSNIDANGAYNQSSDARLKTNIVPVTKSMEKIQSLRGVTFDWKDSRRQPGQHDIGFIAQELLPIVPEAVTKGDDGFYMISYTKVIPVLVEAVKELKKSDDVKIDSLEREVLTLKLQNASLESRLKRMEESLAKLNAQ